MGKKSYELDEKISVSMLTLTLVLLVKSKISELFGKKTTIYDVSV